MKKNEPRTPGRVTLAAIDIGSNAVRLLIKRIDTTAENERKFRKVLLLRVPLRLGFDVFSIGKLSKEKAEKLERLMKGFRQLNGAVSPTTWKLMTDELVRVTEGVGAVNIIGTGGNK